MKWTNLPPTFVILQRINLGLYAILGRLQATANWRLIAEELWPMTNGGPSTELGRQENEWWVTTRGSPMDLEVKRDDYRTVRIVDHGRPDLDDGQTLLRVSRFALTANNVTYAVAGEAMSYWTFFPAAEGWGRVPVWGYADVEASRADGLQVGERVYGYLPMSSHLVVTPTRVSESGFVDATPHRAQLPPAYNQYQRVAGTSDYEPTREREYAILRPLFVTSFLIDDWLDDNGTFGARSVVLAERVEQDGARLGPSVVVERRHRRGRPDVEGQRRFRHIRGLLRPRAHLRRHHCAARRRAFGVRRHGGRGAGARGGAPASRRRALQHSCLVGITHWEDERPQGDVPGPAPTFFFAPDQLVKRRADWGAGGVESHIENAWIGFLTSVDAWLTIEEHEGFDAIEPTWLEVLEGRAAPDVGHVVALSKP